MKTANKEKTKDGYIEAVGRRKTAVARVRLEKKNKGNVEVNGKALSSYFPLKIMQEKVISPLSEIDMVTSFAVSVKVKGGGTSAQAEAIRHGIARALTEIDQNSRTPLKKAGYLRRNPRMKERRKFGLKKARKAAQWSKR